MAVGFYVALVHLGLAPATVLALIILLSRVLKNLGKIQRQYQNLMACEAAFWSLNQTMEEAKREVEPSVGQRVPHFQRELTLEGVSFAYGDHEVLHDISFSLAAGSFTTVVGHSGAGKTTLVDLVTRLLHPSSGRIRVDDEPLDEFDLHGWRRLIGYVG